MKSFFASLFPAGPLVPPMRRVLVLHGYGQNGRILSKRMQALRQECGKDCEFVFLDAPHILRGANSKHYEDPLAVMEVFSDESDPDQMLRAWYSADEKKRFRGIERTLPYLRDYLAHEKPFNAILAFSQGAVLAGALTALLERPELAAEFDFLVDGQMPHPPLYVAESSAQSSLSLAHATTLLACVRLFSEFAVFCSGSLPRDHRLLRIFDATSHTPAGLHTRSLHVIGNSDVVVLPEHSQLLYNASTNARAVYHTGGHFVPSAPAWRTFLRNYLISPNDEEAEIVPQPPTADHVQVLSLVSAHTLSGLDTWLVPRMAGG
ncbi:FSH1-domain-containing protein [Auriculariales sp. MPI-PUGE-AT-0066]|nr:FSH1-domain-containing protein [Auriculariales sp. MPI-PUGE-AT-0066]